MRVLSASSVGTLCMLTTVSIAAGPFQFDSPKMLRSAKGPLLSDAPGYAAPCWADFDGDGKKELVVGQFAHGMMKIYRPGKEGFYQEGSFLEVDGKPAQVPGVW